MWSGHIDWQTKSDCLFSLRLFENQNITKGVSFCNFCCIFSLIVCVLLCLFQTKSEKWKFKHFFLSSFFSLSLPDSYFGQFGLNELFTRDKTAINGEIEHMLTFNIIQKVHMFCGMGTHVNWYKLNLSIKNVAVCWLKRAHKPSLQLFICCQNMPPFFLSPVWIHVYYEKSIFVVAAYCALINGFSSKSPNRSKSPVNQNENKQNTQ